MATILTANHSACKDALHQISLNWLQMQVPVTLNTGRQKRGHSKVSLQDIKAEIPLKPHEGIVHLV